MQDAIHFLDQTSSRADKELVWELMKENWCPAVPGCDAALQVSRNRFERATQGAERARFQHRLSLRSPETSGETRWSETCLAE